MKGKTILVADDSEDLRKAIRCAVCAAGYAALDAADGAAALTLAERERPDLVLADAAMPFLGGEALCRTLRGIPALSGTPVVIMSGSMTREEDVVAGLDGGADDYVLKPFTPRLLLSRLGAVLRRFSCRRRSRRDGLLKCRDLTLDLEAREASLRGAKIALTRKEFDFLALLIEKEGRVLSTRFLLEAVWGYDPADYNDPHTIETHVSRLRKKLGEEVGAWIATVRGLGYKLEKGPAPRLSAQAH